MNLKTLMLDIFIETYVSGDPTRLFNEEVPKEQAQKTWSELVNEYYSLIGDSNYKGYLSKTGRIDDKRAKVIRVVSMYNLLVILSRDKMTSPVLIDELRKEGYILDFKPSDPETYLKELSLIPSRLKKEQRLLESWIDEVVEATKENKVTEQNFLDTIGAIGQHLKVVINPSTTSVWTYCSLIRQLRHGRA